MATLKKSDGSTLSSSLNPITTRRIVQVGAGSVTVAGDSGFDTVTLSASNDAAYAAATANAPIALGIDDIEFRTCKYPENFT